MYCRSKIMGTKTSRILHFLKFRLLTFGDYLGIGTWAFSPGGGAYDIKYYSSKKKSSLFVIWNQTYCLICPISGPKKEYYRMWLSTDVPNTIKVQLGWKWILWHVSILKIINLYIFMNKISYWIVEDLEVLHMQGGPKGC